MCRDVDQGIPPVVFSVPFSLILSLLSSVMAGVGQVEKRHARIGVEGARCGGEKLAGAVLLLVVMVSLLLLLLSS